MDENELIQRVAEEFARANKKSIANELADTAKTSSEPFPISVFMAGSPGAGKTEVSKNLVTILEKNRSSKIIRIDGDELRSRLPGYTGTNSHLFQKSISIIIDEIHNLVLDKKQSFLLDGTFSKYDRAAMNLQRSLKRNREVLVFYVYQAPEVAWKFTEAREVLEGRNIPKSAFIDAFIQSRETVCRIRKEFDEHVVIYLVKKNFETHKIEDILEIGVNGNQIDDYLGTAYTKDDLNKLL